MPLTSFLKNFLQQLPERIQYLGTDVAPLMGPNWQQAISEEKTRNQQMAAAQQAQANLDRQFAAQQSQLGQQNEFERGRMQLTAYQHGLQQVPQPQQSPGGPGLNAGGAAPSFGMGGGQLSAPNIPNSPAPQQSTDDIMEMLQPGWRAMSGQQQSGGQGVNAAGQAAPGGSPAMRMPGMSGDSGGGGGAMVPSAAGAARAIMPTPFNISGLPGQQWQQRPEPMIPIHPDVAKSWPALAAQYPGGMPASMHEKLQPEFDKILTNSAKDVNQTKDTLPEVTLQSQINALGGTRSWRDTAKYDPQLFAKAQGQADDILHPELKAQRQAAEQNLADKHKLNEVQKNNATSFWARVKDDPSAWFDKTEEKSTRDYAQDLAKQRGEEMFIPKKPLEGIRQQSEAYAMDVLSGVNKLRDISKELISIDPKAFGALTGRWNEQMTHLGVTAGNSPRANYLINAFIDNLNPLLARETKQLSGGRAAIQMMNMLKQSFPTLHTNFGALAASFDQAEDIAKNTVRDNRLFSYGISDPKKYYPGEALTHTASGQTLHFKRYTPDGKIETMEEGR